MRIVHICGLALAVAAPGLAQAELIFGLQGSGRIVSFDSAAPAAVVSNLAITGLGAGEVLVGLDLRPANDVLYSLATSGNLYSLTAGAGSYAATLVGNIAVPVLGSNFGFDFNAVPDRLRLVTDGDQNVRINPNNAVTIVDGLINPADLNIVGLGYTNSFAGATMTTLYGIDALTGSLVRSTNPNAGTYVSVGSLGLGLLGSDARVGFDISGVSDIAYLSLNDYLYTVNLSTGGATAVGGIGAANVRGLTVGPRTAVSVPEPTSWALLVAGLLGLGWARRRGKFGRA